MAGVNIGFMKNFTVFEELDLRLQDAFMQEESEVDTRIAIIAIDDESLEMLGQWPWDRSVHAALIDTLSQGNPAVIAFDVIFSEYSSDPEADAALVDAAKRAGNVVFPEYGVFSEYAKRGMIEAEYLAEPFPELKEVSIQGHINTIPDDDGIVRKSLYSFSYENEEITSFSWNIYRTYMEHMGKTVESLQIPLDDWNRFHIPFTGTVGEYEAIPYWMVLSGDVPPEYFTDRIVLIGPYAVGIADDYYYTPLDHKSQMYGVEIHANIIQTFLEQDFKRELHWLWNAFILVVIGVASYLIFHKAHPVFSFIALLIFFTGFIFGGIWLYKFGIIISLAYVLSYLVLLYVGTLIYNYISELFERRRVTDVFGRYVAPQVVDEILKRGEEGVKLGGTRRELTVMFVDIRGFTPLSEKAEPEEVVEILNEYLDLTSRCIFQYGGTLDKFIGDATMAIYNAPLLLENHALKAVQTAWAMQQGSKELEQKLIDRFGVGVKFGIGINTGPAVFGNIGSKTRMDYTAIGDTVNTAARLESNSKPGQILLSESTYLQVKDYVKVTPLGGIKVKGKEQEVQIYQLDGLLEGIV